MSAKAVPCPECGAKNTGKFCGECGASMRRACPACGTAASGGAKFCQECGASLSGAARSGAARAQGNVPWIAVGAAGVILAVVGAFMLIDQAEGPAPTPSQATATSTAAATTAPNITPAQAADQLFNHVMAASERGDLGEARRFAPMALEAYSQLASLDDDGHYHVGMIHMTLDDTVAAQRELDAIRRSVPDHLLGIMLEHAIAEAKGDAAGIDRAFERFLAAYDAEMVNGRDEYLHHRTGIDGFRARASAAQLR